MKRPTLLILLACCAVTVATAPAHAAPAQERPQVDSAVVVDDGVRWYGYKTALADVASIATIYLSAYTQVGPLAMVGVGGMFLGGPFVHAHEDNLGRAGISFGMRLGFTLAGMYLASRSNERDNPNHHQDMSGFFAAVGGGALGMLTAMAADAVFVAYDIEDRTPPKRDLALTPTLGLAPGGAAIGLAGRF